MLFENTELPDLICDQAELGAQQIAHMVARFAVFPMQKQQFSNLGKRKSQLLSAPDELNPSDVRGLKESKAAFGPRRPFEEALLLIEANRVDAQAGLFGNSSDL